MGLFKQKKIRNPAAPAIPDFTNTDKMREHMNDLRNDPDALKQFMVKCSIVRREVQRRWYRVTDELDFMNFYEMKKASGSFEPNYCIVRWDKNYTRHLTFWGSLHKKYDRIKGEHSMCSPGQGFYTYDESINNLRKWIRNITDPKLLTKIEECLLIGMEQITV